MGKLFAFVWLMFIVLLIQGIREKNKAKIIISSVIVAIPIIFFGWLFYILVTTSV